LVNTAELARKVSELGFDTRGATSDTAVLTMLLAAKPDLSVEAAALEVLPEVQGAFSFVFMDENTLYAARDPHGVRPLVLGRLERGWVVASETAALDIVGATVVREVEPGELLAIDEHGLRSSRFGNPTPKGCLFEYVYLARPDSTIAGRNVHAARVEVGRRLAKEHPVEADLVIPVPESGTPAAIGYAEQSGITYGQGLVKNAYVGRTFIQPSQTIRQLGIRLKLNPLRDNVRGKRLVVVDDSIVRGNTQRAIVRMLREAGAIEVHVRISSPPVTWPCFYGIDFATRAELIATGLDTEGVRRSIGADSLGYVSLAGLTAATEQPATRLCRACFDGVYPIELPAEKPDRQAPSRGRRPQARAGRLRRSTARGKPVVSKSHPHKGEDDVAHVTERHHQVTYADAGVSIHAGDKAVELLKDKVQRAHRPEVLAGSAAFPGFSAWTPPSTGSPSSRRRPMGWVPSW
jgi:amidophosphoribosyltransferase